MGKEGSRSGCRPVRALVFSHLEATTAATGGGPVMIKAVPSSFLLLIGDIP